MINSGNPVDDIDLIKTLEASKAKSGEIQVKMTDAEQTEKEIDVTRSQYIPVAVRTQILFFCTTDLVSIYKLQLLLNVYNMRTVFDYLSVHNLALLFTLPNSMWLLCCIHVHVLD